MAMLLIRVEMGDGDKFNSLSSVSKSRETIVDNKPASDAHWGETNIIITLMTKSAIFKISTTLTIGVELKKLC